MLRPIVYLWALPTTCIGLPLVAIALLSGGKARIVAGVLEVHGGLLKWALRQVPIPGGAAAMTLGHIVIARNQQTLHDTRDHERVHVRQVERWGPLFIPAYLGASLWLKLRGRDGYHDNPFEQQAYEQG